MEDEAGRHAPPVGRRPRRPQTASSAPSAAPAKPKSAKSVKKRPCEAEAAEVEGEWTEDQITKLKVMKEDKKSKFNWKVVAKRLKVSVDSAKNKWKRLKVSVDSAKNKWN